MGKKSPVGGVLMGIQINDNLQSLSIQFGLRQASQRMARALETLSSGRRINRAADDAVGMSISKNLQNQIRSFQTNIRSVNNGISIASTVEANLATINDNLGRLRELALQSSTDTINDNQRSLIQEEINQLIAEINNIGETSNFNGANLLDGTFTDRRVMIGSGSGQYLVFSIDDVRANTLGARAEVLGNMGVSANALALGDLQINGVQMPASTADNVSTALAEASAIAKAASINSRAGVTHVRATVESAVHLAAGASISDVTLDGANTLSINGVLFDDVQVSAIDNGQSLIAAINERTNETGVVASLGAGGELVLTAEDGRNIQVQTTGGIAHLLGLQLAPGDFAGGIGPTNDVITGKISLIAMEDISLGGNLASIGFDDPGQALTAVDPNTALNSLDVTTQEGAQAALTIIDLARENVLRNRTQLGAVQNRLEGSVEKLSLTVEQLSASDSRIVDADYAEETAELAKAQILQEVGLAILAQANAVPQMALDLLMRG
jgi:flagellin